LVGIIDVFNKDKNYHFLSVLKCAKETIARYLQKRSIANIDDVTN